MKWAKSLICSSAMWVLNRFEGAVQWSARRSYIPGFVRDARFDVDSATRTELVRKARYFERNNAILNRLADLFEQFTVGPCGLQFIPSSSDEEWNQRAKAWWDQWSSFCDLNSLLPLGTLMSLAARSWFVDGEIFILLTRGEEMPGQPARPRIQLVEAHRVKTPADRMNDEGKSIIDGIEVDKRGRPTFYHVSEVSDLFTETFRKIHASQVIHIFEPSRPGQYRGLSFCYPVINDLNDLDDLQMLEMDGAKEAAATTNVITNAAGEVPPADLRRQRYTNNNQNSSGVETTENRVQYFKTVLGGRTVALKPNETYQQFKNERPSVASREYWDYLTAKICIGTGIAKLLVMPYASQGTVTRADLDVNAGFFRARSMVLIAAFTRVYHYVMEWATRNVPEIADAPEDFRSVSSRPPRSANVDVGRNSTALLAELEAGIRTYESICAELGEDWRTVLKQRAKEEAYIDKVAKDAVVSPERIRKSIADILSKQMASNSTSTPAQQEEVKP